MVGGSLTIQMNNLAERPLALTQAELQKRDVGRSAALEVESGMKLGLGTGSTVAFFLEALAQRMKDGEVTDVVGVPTSLRTEEACRSLGIPLGDLRDLSPLDLCVDGADEVDPHLNAVKGLGGALLREKMVAQASGRFVIIADLGKEVAKLGTRSPLPVEVVPFQWPCHERFLNDLGASPELRLTESGDPYVTDNQNFILDCHFSSGIDDPEALGRALEGRAGVVEHGLFLGLAEAAFLGTPDGVVVRRLGDRS